MLVENTDADLILNRYPGAIDGNVPSLDPVVSNDRYTLLRVVEHRPTQRGELDRNGGTGQTRLRHDPGPERQHRLAPRR